MITEDRRAEMYEIWGAETNDTETEEWREHLTEEEAALVDDWDSGYEAGYLRLCEAILALEKGGTI